MSGCGGSRKNATRGGYLRNIHNLYSFHNNGAESQHGAPGSSQHMREEDQRNGQGSRRGKGNSRPLRDVNRQHRASGYQDIRALCAFNQQHEVFDRGGRTFRKRLEPTSDEIIDFVNKENRHLSRKMQRPGYGWASLELVRAESRALSQISAEVKAMI